MHQSTSARNLGLLALSAVLATGAFAQKTTISDAEIQATLLKSFAADARLADDPVHASAAFGNVTLTGAVRTEAERDNADRIASTTDGVRKVIDQLRVGDTAVADARTSTPAQIAGNGQGTARSANPSPTDGNIAAGEQALSDAELEDQQYGGAPGGTQGNPYPSPQQGGVQSAQNNPQPAPPQQSVPGPAGQGYPSAGSQGYPQAGSQGYPPNVHEGYPSQQGYPPEQGYPSQQGYPGGTPGGYPPAGNAGYPPPSQQGRLYRRDYERQLAQRNGPAPNGYGQPGGQPVSVPNGTVLRVRIDRWLSSGDAEPGSTFTAIVENDIAANRQVAIPRGATVTGEVVDAIGAGALKGRGTLTLQLTGLTLAGQTVPLVSEPFTVSGRDKAAQSVTSTIAGGAIGAIIGGAVGGGAGAAIGAGVGGVAGLGTSAVSGGGNAVLPNEALLHFRLVQPVRVITVSEAEMQRLGQYAGPASRGPQPGPYAAYPGPYPYPYPVAYPRYGYPGYFYGRPYLRGGYGYGY